MRRFALVSIAAMFAFAVWLGGGHSATSAATTAPRGVDVFTANCSSCHGADGRGMAGAIPPLAGNPVVVGDSKRVIHIVKNGLDDRIVVNGVDYEGRMPEWNSVLNAREIAAVLTYVRSAWGNHASAVTVAQVNAQK